MLTKETLQKVSEYDQEKHNHKLKTNPRHREEELHDIYSIQSTTKAKQRALSVPRQVDYKTRKDIE